MGELRAREGKKEEESGPDEFANDCDDETTSRDRKHIEDTSEDMFERVNF